MTDIHPDSPEIPVTRTRRGFSIDAAALREALEGTASTVTFTAPEGWHFGDDRRLHPDDPPARSLKDGRLITAGELTRIAARLVRTDYDDAVHGEGICRDAFARLIADASGQDKKAVEQAIDRLAPYPSWRVTRGG